MSTPLDLAQTQDLIEELKKRYTALVVLGAHVENCEEITSIMEGPIFMVAGLLHQAGCEITAELSRPCDEE